MVAQMKRAALGFALGFVMSGCGRYKPPLPPEMFAPKAVDALSVTASEVGVVFAWTAPDEDRRGKELALIDGYAIQRKTIAEKGDETNPKIRFQTIGFIRDQHVKVREEMRAAARAEGKIGRTIESPAEYTKFSFVDPSAQRSTTYMYQVLPQNQAGTDGVVREVARVTFNGAASDIAMVPSLEVPEDDTRIDDPGALF
jgi:hypothetical protein